MYSLEEKFWSRVWQCDHRHPCKKCCWPYETQRLLDYRYGTPEWAEMYGIFYLRNDHGAFQHPALATSISAHRMAYILSGKNEIFQGIHFPVCHRCDFGLCCNYVHLTLGAMADNRRDMKGKGCLGIDFQPIFLPDGTRHVPVDKFARRRIILSQRKYP